MQIKDKYQQNVSRDQDRVSADARNLNYS